MGSRVEDARAALDAAVGAMGTGGERRDGQASMCEAVAEAVNAGRHLIVGAGTGTGKSLGYLAALATSGKVAVVATATKALQDQLVGKDLPKLEAALGRPLRFAVLKGRSNYLCKQALTVKGGMLGDLAEHASGADTARTRQEIRRLADWAENTDDGDRAGLLSEPSPAAWSAVSVSGRECPGATRCPAGDSCFAEAARAKAAKVDILVVNTHLYALHVFGGGDMLPPHDVVVFDEAHTIEDIASAAAGVSLTASRFVNAGRAARAAGATAGTRDAMAAAGRSLREALHPHRGRLLSDLPADLSEAADVCRASVDKARAEIRNTAGAETQRLVASRMLDAIADDLLSATNGDSDDAVWVEGPDSNPTWRTAPVNVGTQLERRLWSQVTSVLTSATIPANLPEVLGIPAQDCDTLNVPSPFDYATRGLLYCAKHLPDPRDDDRAEQAHAELARLAVAAGGRTLALFTSYAAMDRAADAVRGRTALRIDTQRDYPKKELLRRFSDDEEACLFATMGMWQGVDVPGRSLSLLVVDRIPFPRPDDPLLTARRSDHGAGAFAAIDVPRAALLLAQGVGRLIRTATDRGVVAVLDSRLATARYRWELINGLPPLRRTANIAEAEAFLEQIRRSARAA